MNNTNINLLLYSKYKKNPSFTSISNIQKSNLPKNLPNHKFQQSNPNLFITARDCR